MARAVVGLSEPVGMPVSIVARLFGPTGALTSNTRSGRRLGNVALLAFIIPLAYLVLTPLIRLQMRAFQDDASGYRKALDLSGIAKVLRTTVALALGSLAIALVLGTFLAWMSTLLPRRWQWLATLPMLPIVMPAVAFVTGWATLLSPRVGYINTYLRKLPFFSDLRRGPIDVFSPTWIIILTGFALTSFIYIFMRAGMRRISFEQLEAAYVCGSRPRHAFVRVVLPLLRPSFIYGGSIALLLGLGQFTAPLLLGGPHAVRVVTTEIHQFTHNSPIDHGIAAAIASPLLVFGIVVVLIQRMLLSNQDRFVTDVGKGTSTVARPSKSAPIWLATYGILAVLLPFLALLVAALSPFYSGRIDFAVMTWKNFETVLSTPVAMESIRTSLIASIAGVLVSLPIGYFAAEIIYNRRGGRFLRTFTDFLVNLPLGVPAVVFGAGFLFTYTKPPFVLYGTRWVIILVYITIMLPFSTRLQLAARMTMGSSFEAAARVSGAGALRTHLTVVVPMIKGAISGAGALMFVLLTHEFSASLLVKSTRTHLMGTALYDFWVYSSYPVMASMAVIMCVVTTAGVAVAMKIGGGAKALDRL
jgi:iron(III) transport system permease protein